MEKKREITFNEFPIPTYEQWRTTTEKALKGRSFETLMTTLLDDIILEPMYQQKDLDDCSTLVNEPGVFPFVRGNQNGPKAWKISQELEAATPKLLNETLRYDLARGQNVIHLVLSNEMKNGKKPIVSEKEIGTPLFDFDDLKQTLEGIDVSEQSIYVDAGIVSLPLLAAFQLISDQLEGTIASDPIHQLATEGELTYSLTASFDHMKSAVEWAKLKHENLRTVLVQTHIYHNGGVSAAKELAIALSTGVRYVSELMERGVSADDAGKAMTFSFSIGSDFFSELAKIRTARLLWATIMKEFGAEAEAQKMRIHARTSAFTKSRQDPYVNLLRGTSEAFAAAVAGVDSLHVSPLDEAIQRSSAFSRRIARNTSLILQEEAYVGVTADPAGGSWYVEHLTEQLAKEAWKAFLQIEQSGGIIESLKSKLIQTWVDQTWEKRKADVESRKQTVLGSNRYVDVAEKLPPKSEIDEVEWNNFARKLDKNVVMKGVERPKTLKEMEDLLLENRPFHLLHNLLQEGIPERGVARLTSRRLAEPFEKLRNKMSKIEEKLGKRPTALLIGLDTLAEHKPRVDFSSEFFQSAGFDIKRSVPVKDVNGAVEAAKDSSLIVVCGSDVSYHAQALAIVQAITSDHDCFIYLAGRPSEELRKDLMNSGLHGIIHVKSNAYHVLDELLEEIGGSL
ncbi:methylmalonyl-CoA mutase family protein [Halalkalibacter alkalisediminis]|uniref:Methylmalonyl-CoA mutase family protein n=1 Tax=Halalkalibacter alkalisediminis TaxID=935616 RepID=A0ABV6NAE1_9BACI|nr:methylmalonyl-CoA mutase family protein [Halalkalibacter alkalisediminis]